MVCEFEIYLVCQTKFRISLRTALKNQSNSSVLDHDETRVISKGIDVLSHSFLRFWVGECAQNRKIFETPCDLVGRARRRPPN